MNSIASSFRSIPANPASPQPERILHVIKPDRLGLQPASRADGTGGEGHAGGRLVGEFHALNIEGDDLGIVNGVIAHGFTKILPITGASPLQITCRVV